MVHDTSDIGVVLFDLGGVLVELAGSQTLRAWTPSHQRTKDLWHYWLTSPIVRAFESGKTDPDQFADALIKDLMLPVDRETFLEAFTRWPKGLFPGALDLIDTLPTHVIRATLSNTNTLHWPRLMREMGLAQRFDHHFPSHLTGHIKPDKAPFQAIMAQMHWCPRSILFMDDNQLNVDTANLLSIRAFLVHGVQEARAVLKHTGVLT